MLPNRYTAEEIGKRLGVNPERLKELARAGYAPCWLNESNEPCFRIGEMKIWVENNLYRRSDGSELPFKIHVHALDRAKPSRPVPRELSSIDDLCEYKFISFPPSVYFLIKDSKVLYVGQAANLPSRISNHHIPSDRYDRVLYKPIPLSDLDRIEKEFIVALDPPLNKYKPKKLEQKPK